MKRGPFSNKKSIDARRFSSRTWASISGTSFIRRVSAGRTEVTGKGIDLKKMLGRTDRCAGGSGRQDSESRRCLPSQRCSRSNMRWPVSGNRLGITPDAIVGHSMGEYVAACLAGVLSLEDALRLIATRAKLVNELPQGAMLAVTLPENELLPLLPEDLSISLINGPTFVRGGWSGCCRGRVREDVDCTERHLSACSECPCFSLENARSDREGI